MDDKHIDQHIDQFIMNLLFQLKTLLLISNRIQKIKIVMKKEIDSRIN
mgnify:CR=1 FL=1